MESIEAKSSTEKLPSEIRFACIPYHGLSPQTIGLRLSVTTTRDTLQFVIRIRNHDALIEAISRELCQKIKDEIGSVDGNEVYIGSFTQ